MLRAVVEASPCPLVAYLQMLSLSHTIRTKIRGTLRELSLVVSPDPVDPVQPDPTIPAITTDALAALVGPCTSLRKLVFPESWSAMNASGMIDETCDWVDVAFGGHTQLAVLDELPWLPECTIERILSHLPGLVELKVPWFICLNTRLLAALARFCPGLQALRCPLSNDQADLAALAPLSGVLKKVDFIGGAKISNESLLAAFVRSLSAVTSLTLPCRCPPAAFEPIASHLTTLELTGILHEDEDLPGPWLCRLEAFSCIAPFSASMVQLLTANQATLRRLKLMLGDIGSLSPAASLRALPHLTHLDLHMMDATCPFSALLPPDLVDRLESLSFTLGVPVLVPVRIASSRLQRLQLCLGLVFGLALDCPALVELDLTQAACRLTSFQCPRLRTIGVPGKSMTRPAPMPDLEEVTFRGPRFKPSTWPLEKDPAWLLAGSSPRLRVLTGIRLTRPGLLARLCACGSLVRLERLFLDVTRLPNPLVLRLPGQLERLDLRIIANGGDSPSPLDLQVEAPGLLDFSLSTTENSTLTSARVRLRNCPYLVDLYLKCELLDGALLSLQVDDKEEEAGTRVAMQPRKLTLASPLEAASLLDLVTQHGAHLRGFAAWRRGLRAMNEEDWPQLMGALSKLPQLTSLDLDVSSASSPLSFACPKLRTLSLGGLSDEAKVVLACPLLGQLRGIGDPSRQLELALPAPKLRF
ncbi:hypothetical protein PAPYR_587 [Paratrimastix pyriformis]|uniref:Uncharacterized protein n=1 Tax=Paratrimastix pyriformis TaxID=342808 RepID=A0ABQ8V0J6_9EUKA|nr:hypothetical protein PAPYR_587 [Paratrimastix pyriformis]